MVEATDRSGGLSRKFMTDFKAMLCIIGGVALVMCAIFYGFLFYIYPEGASSY